MQCGKRLNAEADVRIQMSSIKPGIKDSLKNVKQSYSSHYAFWYVKYRFFSKNVIYIKMFIIIK